MVCGVLTPLTYHRDWKKGNNSASKVSYSAQCLIEKYCPLVGGKSPQLREHDDHNILLAILHATPQVNSVKAKLATHVLQYRKKCYIFTTGTDPSIPFQNFIVVCRLRGVLCISLGGLILHSRESTTAISPPRYHTSL